MNEKEKEIFRKNIEEEYGDSDKGIHKGKTLEQRSEDIGKREDRKNKKFMNEMYDGNEEVINLMNDFQEKMRKLVSKQMGLTDKDERNKVDEEMNKLVVETEKRKKEILGE